MENLIEDQRRIKQEMLEFIKGSSPLVRYEVMEIPANTTFRLTSLNSFFPTVIMNSGSVFEIVNASSPSIPVRLEIGELKFKPNGPAALMRFSDRISSNHDGSDGPRGRRGNDAFRDASIVTQATHGTEGLNGEHGQLPQTRGILNLKITNITVVPNVNLTRSIFSIDGKGIKGGDGGNGGNGGDGGNGVLGRNGAHDCDFYNCRCTRGIMSGSAGGNGANGADPGKGANGGKGATINFTGPDETFSLLYQLVDVQGGTFGVGGWGGAGGIGGSGAPAYGGGGGHCGRDHAAMPAGSNGEFRNLLRGSSGNNGANGTFQHVANLKSFEDSIDDIIKEM